jgi:hypothetical protein
VGPYIMIRTYTGFNILVAGAGAGAGEGGGGGARAGAGAVVGAEAAAGEEEEEEVVVFCHTTNGARLRLILTIIPGGAILLGSSPSLITFCRFLDFWSPPLPHSLPSRILDLAGL